MNKNTLEIIEYLVEYTDILNDTAQEIAEKILFDGSLDDLDALENETYKKDIEPLMSPKCQGTGSAACNTQATVQTEFVLECYQSGIYQCDDCRLITGLKEAS